MKILGRLERVSIRDTWSIETDFSNWLSEKDNLKLLGDAIGIEIYFENREKPIGRYRADIICKDGEGNKVVIENKFEAADHDHLGKAITYAAREDAASIIWVAEEFRQEELDALKWLNKKTNGNVYFFAVKIVVVKIGNSKHAPDFRLVIEPDNWRNASQPKELKKENTKTQQLYDKYLASLVEFVGNSFECGKSPAPGQLDVICPTPQFHCGFDLSVRGRYMGVYLSSDKKDRIEFLRSIIKKKKAQIEREIGEQIHSGKTGRWFWLAAEITADPSDTSDWLRQHEWLKQTLGKLIKSVSKYYSTKAVQTKRS